jgi:CheY-like chemotaxis protein
MNRALDILVVDEEVPITGAIASVLARRGHDVTVARNAAEALAQPAPQVLVSDLALADATGFELLEELHRRGARPHTIFVTGRPTVADCSRALLLGAAEVLTKPFRLDDLVRAVEGGSVPSPAAQRDPAHAFERWYACRPESVEHAARDVAAFALSAGAGPAARARMATACAEIVDNACRHAYPRTRGDIGVTAHADKHGIAVEVRDRGAGFDTSIVDSRVSDSASSNGLRRALALCESMRIDSDFGRGTRVRMSFTVHPVEFDEGLAIDLCEHDYMTPALARRVLHALRRPASAGLYRLSPALAVVVGRLLAGPDTVSAISGKAEG